MRYIAIVLLCLLGLVELLVRAVTFPLVCLALFAFVDVQGTVDLRMLLAPTTFRLAERLAQPPSTGSEA